MRKMKRSLIPVLAAFLLFGASASISTHANAAAQSVQSDTNLQAEITNKALNKSKFKNVQSSVSSGIVTLTGTVDVYDAKEDADGLAKGQYIPHVIEPSAGVDRLILALIANAFTEITDTDDKGKSETRVIMKFHPRVAPIKVGIMPLLKNKPDLVKKAIEVRDLLRPHMNVFYDDGGSIGRRYARQDEAGTPYCVTIDFDSLGEKPELLNTVTLRHRDDGKQERLAISELPAWLLAKVR